MVSSSFPDILKTMTSVYPLPHTPIFIKAACGWSLKYGGFTATRPYDDENTPPIHYAVKVRSCTPWWGCFGTQTTFLQITKKHFSQSGRLKPLKGGAYVLVINKNLTLKHQDFCMLN